MEGLPVVDVPYFNNQGCVELLTRHKHGLSDIINHHAKSNSSTETNMLDTFTKYNSTHGSFSNKQSETGQRLFAIQHFPGQVTYNPNHFLESNKDILNADLVQLIRGSETAPASYNSFAVELFSNDNIRTETHPKQSDAILNAQQPSGPLRGPSMRRTKSTKRRRTSGIEPTIAEEEPMKSSTSTTHVSMVLSQLNKSLDELIVTLDETVPWFIICIKPNENAAPNQFDSNLVRSQIRAWGIPQICQRLKVHYTSILFHDEFLERYTDTLESIGLDTSLSPKEQCEAVINYFEWSNVQATLGATKVFCIVFSSFFYL